MANVDVSYRLRTRPAATRGLPQRLADSARQVPRSAPVLERWLAERRGRSPFEVVQVPFERLEGWSFAPDSGNLAHATGRFFSVEGVHVRTDYGHVREWWQPIINQTDGGILGILTREIGGVLHFLMQAKMEPGNVNAVQFSPTVQATPSNFRRVHKGAEQRYIEFFTEPGRARMLVDVLQSEQGSWFRGKRNRNIVMEVTGPIEPHEDFIWLTLGEIFELLRRPNLVNMDARTVLSCLPLPAFGTADDDEFHEVLRRSIAAGDDDSLHPLVDIRSWLSGRKVSYELRADPIPLNAVVGWHRNADEIAHQDGKYFTVGGVSVHASNREVRSWCQPLLTPRGTGLVAFVVRSIGGVLHVLARADVRPGYRDTVELGPTVHCTPENYADAPAERRPRFLDLIVSGEPRVRYDVQQSEEGGRFQRALTRHLVLEVGDDFPMDTPPDFAWLTLAQLKALARASYQVNIEARSLTLCLHDLR